MLNSIKPLHTKNERKKAQNSQSDDNNYIKLVIFNLSSSHIIKYCKR